MVIIQANPLKMTAEELDTQKKKIVSEFQEKSKEFNLASLYIQFDSSKGTSFNGEGCELLHGSESIEETLLGKKFFFSIFFFSNFINY